MTIYTNDLVKLTDEQEIVFNNQWVLDGLDKPRIKTINGKDVMLTQSEINVIESERIINSSIANENERIRNIKNDGLLLMQAKFPALHDIDHIKFQAEFWLSIAPEARQATDNFQLVIDLYTIAKTAIINGTASSDVVWV